MTAMSDDTYLMPEHGHPLQLILAEEAGYERGLRDAAREATQPPSNS